MNKVQAWLQEIYKLTKSGNLNKSLLRNVKKKNNSDVTWSVFLPVLNDCLNAGSESYMPVVSNI